MVRGPGGRFAGGGAWNFHVLLVVLVGVVLLAPLAEQGVVAARWFTTVGMLLVLLASVRVISDSPLGRWSGRGLFALWLVAQLVQWLLAEPGRELAAVRVLDVLVFGWILVRLVHALLLMQRVDARVISASICAYLMIGVWFAVVFRALGGDAFAGVEQGPGGPRFTELLYFSFVTLTSLGYGDVTPAAPIARSLAVIEVACGQLYLAVLIARQVGMYIADRGAAGGEA